MSEFIMSLVMQCLTVCCQRNSKYDIVSESEIFHILDEIKMEIDKHRWNEVDFIYNRTFWNALKLLDCMLQTGGYNGHQCFVYCFRFYNLFARFGVAPSKPNASYFYGFG